MAPCVPYKNVDFIIITIINKFLQEGLFNCISYGLHDW